MGLDTVELVMEVEAAFGIAIPDEEAEKIQTVGQLYHYVLARIDGSPLSTSGCLSAAAFYRVRRQLMARFRVERQGVREAPRSPRRGRLVNPLRGMGLGEGPIPLELDRASPRLRAMEAMNRSRHGPTPEVVYAVDRGYLRITSEGATIEPDIDDPSLIVGHCLLSLAAAGLGAAAAPMVAGPRADRPPPPGSDDVG